MAGGTENRRNLIVCADDYGLAPGVSRGIRELIEDSRLSATGCMTASPNWPSEAREIQPLIDRADIGLHLSLTTLPTITAASGPFSRGRPATLGEVVKAAVFGALNLDEIRSEFQNQLDQFETHMGRPPNFLDGHHHIHQLPGIRDVFIDIAAQVAERGNVYIRTCNERLSNLAKRRVSFLGAFGLGIPGRALAKRARRHGIPFNGGFTGVYDFAPTPSFGDRVDRFLMGAQNQTIMMCHPGHVDQALRDLDSLTDQREQEFQYLKSDDFLNLLSRRGLAIGRFGFPDDGGASV